MSNPISARKSWYVCLVCILQFQLNIIVKPNIWQGCRCSNFLIESICRPYKFNFPWVGSTLGCLDISNNLWPDPESCRLSPKNPTCFPGAINSNWNSIFAQHLIEKIYSVKGGTPDWTPIPPLSLSFPNAHQIDDDQYWTFERTKGNFPSEVFSFESSMAPGKSRRQWPAKMENNWTYKKGNNEENIWIACLVWFWLIFLVIDNFQNWVWYEKFKGLWIINWQRKRLGRFDEGKRNCE